MKEKKTCLAFLQTAYSEFQHSFAKFIVAQKISNLTNSRWDRCAPELKQLNIFITDFCQSFLHRQRHIWMSCGIIEGVILIA